jgi:hypothetical protein
MASASPTARVDALNCGLIVASAAAAWIVPFELFLLSYAVLGPLHYLTEISWLHDRGYYTTGRYDAVLLAGLGALAFATRFDLPAAWDGWVVLAFALAAAFAFVADSRRRTVVAVVAVGLAVVLTQWSTAGLLLAILLPTVIHVFVFTFFFLLHGSLRSRSRWGFASVGAFLLCAAALLLIRPAADQYSVSPRTAALATEFGPVIDHFLALFGDRGWDNLAAAGRFLAFAYTYHYLNWFSKTGIIRWHAVGTTRLTLIAGLYGVSLALYAYDYRVGLVGLALLSMVHVFLEFPLDLRTIAAVTLAPRARP